MGFYRPPLNDGTPNEKPYWLRYPDGDIYVLRDRGTAQREFTLVHAINIADSMADEGLMVTDPETDAVLWAGVPARRSTR